MEKALDMNLYQKKLDDLTEFEIKLEHIKLLQKMFVGWNRGEFGAPAIDSKKPYGNSNVIADIAEIIGEPSYESDDGERYYVRASADKCRKLHAETRLALQIILRTGQFQIGKYIRPTNYTQDWVLQ